MSLVLQEPLRWSDAYNIGPHGELTYFEKKKKTSGSNLECEGKHTVVLYIL